MADPSRSFRGTGRAQTAPARVGERHDRGADSRRAVAVVPFDRGRVARVHRHYGEVEVAVAAGHLAGLAAAVAEGDGHLVAAQVVGVSEHLAGVDQLPASKLALPSDPFRVLTGPHGYFRSTIWSTREPAI